MPVPFRPELDSLQTYVPPKSWRMAAEGRADDYAKLTSNELAFGPLPEAEAALSEVLPRVNRYPDSHASRLRQVVLNLVDQRDGREFRWYCRLARHIDGPDLRNQLERRLRDANGNVRRRAGWVLDVLGPDPAVRAKRSR